MIQVINDAGIYRVAAFCDACNEEITNAELAMYTWAETAADHSKEGQHFTPHFYHKGQCAESTAFRNQFPLWDELSRFPVYLGENIEVDWKWALESAKRVSRL